MNEVYVVRQFFGDCNDNDYVGVYTDFWKALAAAIANQKENWGDRPQYGFGVRKPSAFASGGMLWCEVLWDGKPQGIYYTINRMELE